VLEPGRRSGDNGQRVLRRAVYNVILCACHWWQETSSPRVSFGAWAVGVISTVVTGIGGGAIAVQYFGLQEWVDSVTGLVALGGLIFGCGLPGWAIVRWVFNFIEKNRDAGIDEVAKEVKEVL
jgi:hypothetical protein